MTPIFNYIITIHNKEELIEQVLNAVIKCCGANSYIYPVLDGCTDSSEEIVDRIISQNPLVSIKKIRVDDVHEIKSINAGLKFSEQSVEGYNIILQDDVILGDFSIEKKVVSLYEEIPQLGYVSFRLGANLKGNILSSHEGSPFTDYIENAFGHGTDQSKPLLPGQFAFRSIAIKSPVCIPTLIIDQFGLLDENLSPCFHDDTEYCLKLLSSGFNNGVFAIEYQSELEWGGTRKKENHDLYNQIKKNMDYLRIQYHDQILQIISKPQRKELVTVETAFDLYSREKGLKQYKENRRKRMKFESKGLSAPGKLKYYLKQIIKALLSLRK